MSAIFDFFSNIFGWIWKFLNVCRVLISCFFFLLMVLMVIVLLHQPKPVVPNDCALVLAPTGNIVEQRTIDKFTVALDEFMGMGMEQETLLRDLLDVINNAAGDKRVKLMVLDTSRMGYVGFNQLRSIGKSLEEFKKNNKVIIATGDSYNQAQYYLASYADEVYLNPMGEINMKGFGVFRLYFKNLLDDLRVKMHLFIVGSYKSAMEPFTRNDMSREAKQDNRGWLNNLWRVYCEDVAEHRGLTVAGINDYVNNIAGNMRRAQGNAGQMALNAGLIDGFKTRQELIDYLTSLVGRSANGDTFKRIDFGDYLANITPSFTDYNGNGDYIGVVVAQGNIIHGEQEPGIIGSLTLAEQIRRAREDASIKALVLRIDSGGGSAFASEVIRQELLLTKQSGKPVVVSMGSMAASGGYWIAAAANKIVASPVTLTGSIGIFGAFPTFEQTLADYGIHSDGTGTTRLAGDGDPTRPLSLDIQQALQLRVEEGYSRFLEVVSTGRDLSLEEVEALAQGRVWDGAAALEKGLVDKLGTLDDAVAEAANLTGLADFKPVYLEPELSPGEEFLRQLGRRGAQAFNENSMLVRAKQRIDALLSKQFDFLLRADDPSRIYAHCLLPPTAVVY